MKHAVLAITLLLGALLLVTGRAIAANAGTSAPDDDLDRQFAQLEPLVFHPNLLPVILGNTDMIELSPAQVQGLRAWRNKNARKMIKVMKQVALARIEFQTAALSPLTPAEELQAFQSRIFELQREVLDYKLDCRNNIMQMFTRENWENLYMVLADQGSEIPLPAYGEKPSTLAARQ